MFNQLVKVLPTESYHNNTRKHPGIDSASCKSLQFGIARDSRVTVKYASGSGKKLHTPAMVTHFPPTSSTDRTKAAYTTDTDTKPMTRRTETYCTYDRTRRDKIASTLCATIMLMRIFLRPNLELNEMTVRDCSLTTKIQ